MYEIAYLKGSMHVSIGENIKKLRKSSKISIRKLAELSEVSKTTINEIENDIVKNPKIETLQQIAKGLNTPLMSITNELRNYADYKDDLSIHEPQLVYNNLNHDEYLGPLTKDEAAALKAYLKVYRETKAE